MSGVGLKRRAGRIVLACAALVFGPGRACAEDARALFDAAVHTELHGGATAADAAFALYRQAAETGLPEAEFNVAVMLDSGRGVARDVSQAATWYARAASHGHSRAAYNLGQLYAAGEGVPTNPDLARVWFEASGLPAARARSNALPKASADPSGLLAPSTVSPAPTTPIVSSTGGVEFVWTAPPSTEPLCFLLEIRDIDAAQIHEVFADVIRVSSTFVVLPDPHGAYAWRVTAIAPKAGRYRSTEWVRFPVGAPSKLSSK